MYRKRTNRDIEEASFDLDVFRNLYNIVLEEHESVALTHPSPTHSAAAKHAIAEAYSNYEAYMGYYVEALLPNVIDELVDI